jgi:PrtD family type I secretion system ABC transporter
MSDSHAVPLARLLRRPLLAVGGFSFVMNLLLLAPALFMLQVFDRVLSSGSSETLLVLLGGVVIALLLSLALDHVRSRLQGVIGTLLGEALLPDVARRVLARAASLAQRGSGEALRDVATLRGLFSAQALVALFDAPWVFVYVAVIWFAHPALGIAAAAAAVVMLGLAVLNDRVTRGAIESLQREAGGVQRFLETSMANAEAAQVMGMGPALLARWERLNGPVLELQRSAAGRSVALAAVTRTMRQAVQVLILALGAYLVITQAATPGVMIATTILLGRALAPVEQVVGSWKTFVEGRLAYRRLSELLAGDAGGEGMRLPAPSGALDASGVILRAPGSERLLLSGVSLNLAPGESLVVIGPSGAGKSTLVRVLAGLWPPTSGVVRLDGADVMQWPRETLGPYIGYVPQDVQLFPGTVAENIARLGEVDADAVVAAATLAGVHEMILGLPAGYDTRLEPGGTLLSPGQRQRIALARALYGSPRVLLLDEPNANLDGAGEQALGQALAALRGRMTVVMVTHRTTLVQHADKMLLLEGGRVRQFGPVADVMQSMKAAGSNVVAMPRGHHAESG